MEYYDGIIFRVKGYVGDNAVVNEYDIEYLLFSPKSDKLRGRTMRRLLMSHKAIPNLLTGARMVLTMALLFPTVPGAAFAALYLAAGLTDMLDGWLARRLHAVSVFGARLDSAADFFFVAVALFRLWPVAAPGTAVLLWVGGIALLRLGAALAAKVRFGRFGFLHTRANKYTGLLLFCYPFSLFFTRSQIVPYFLCAAATLSAVEELLLELTAKHWDPNRAELFTKSK